MISDPLLEVENLEVRFPVKSSILRRKVGEIRAVDGVSFQVRAGATLALVGESGCGKSSTGRAIVGLEPPGGGRISFDGTDITRSTAARRRELAREIQIVFQDPFASLNPRLTIRNILEEGWLIHKDIVPRDQWGTEVDRLLDLVGLNSAHAKRYPHQFSGGQRQRIGIARALSMRPKLIVCDEPVSSLDVSIQAQVLNLLEDLQDELGVAYLFISHDLHVVQHVADDVAVMYLGAIVEQGPVEQVFANPQHPYTRSLLSAAPTAFPWREPERAIPIVLSGDLPSPAAVPSGCRFRTRCFMARQECATIHPVLEGSDHHRWACPFTALAQVSR